MKDLQLPPKPTFTGPDLNKVIKDLKIQLDANKNCLNCKDHIFVHADILECKIHPRKYLKICEDWRQL